MRAARSALPGPPLRARGDDGAGGRPLSSGCLGNRPLSDSRPPEPPRAGPGVPPVAARPRPGVASCLVHEVGHQAAALLGLVESLRLELQRMQRERPAAERPAWTLWERWTSEIVADFWAIGKVGIASTLGLIGVVSLPRWFVFRM